jgi:uncharacterized protein (TIGR02145 family)
MAQNLVYNSAEGSVCYDNSILNCDRYGRLYNYVTAKKSCPEGWHLPSNEEWSKLIVYLGGESMASGRLMLQGDSGFGAIMAGYRHTDGYFKGLGDSAYFWSATGEDKVFAWYYQMYTERNRVSQGVHLQDGYLTVRCIKD